MKGISIEKKKSGKIYYRAYHRVQGEIYRKCFKEQNEAIEWLEKQRQKHPNRRQKLPLENDRFTDISFSGLTNKSNNKLYIAFDKKANTYRLVTTDQIKKKESPKNRGYIEKNKSGTYSLKMKKGTKRWTIETFKTKKEAIKKQKQVLNQVALGKPIKISAKTNTGFKYISKSNNKNNFHFHLNNKKSKISRHFHTLQEALDYREKYFKENGLEMPKDYIELNFN